MEGAESEITPRALGLLCSEVAGEFRLFFGGLYI